MPATQRALSHLLAIPVLLSTTIASAVAQEGLALEEVIVTAQKREQTLQDVPISVAAFSSEMLETRGIDELEDIGAQVPNLVLNAFNNDATTVRLFIRGIGQNDVQLTQDPSVALYIDGVYVGTSVGTGTELVDLARIEILRGPQGTLYGRNATGGAVNLISQRPDLENFGIKQRLDAGNYGLFKSRTMVNLPVLEDRAAIKLAYLHSERDGTVDNDIAGPDWGEEERDAWRVDVSAALSEELMLDYAFDYSDIGDNSRLEMIHDAVNPLGLATFCTALTPNRPDNATPCRPLGDSDVDVYGHSLILSWEVSDNLTIKSITGYRDVESEFFHDGTPTVGIIANNPATWSIRMTDFEQFTQEIQFLGAFWDDQVEYVAGLYYYDDDSEQSSEGWSVLGLRSGFDDTESDNTSYAAFTQLTYTPDSLEDWHFTLGMRYSYDEREAFRINENSLTFAEIGGFTPANCADPYFQGAACPPDPGAVVAGAPYDEDFSNFNPSFTVAYDWNQDVNVYGKVVTGYKSGGTSQRSANPESFGEGFEEEDVISWELGMKGRFWDNRLSVNSALFYMEIDGFQASVQTGLTAGDRDFTPIDDNEIAGVELDMTVLLAEGLQLTLGYGYLDTEMGVDEVVTLLSDGSTQVTEVVPEIAYAPEHSFTAALDYAMDTAFGDLSFYLGYSYQDEAVTSLNEFDNLPTDDRGLWDADITLSNVDMLRGTLRFSLWGKNLTDEEYLVVNTGSLRALFPNDLLGLSPWSTWGDPMTYGATVEYVY